MLWRALVDAERCAKWVTGDTVYGSHRPLREGLEARKQAYALAVSCQEQGEVQAMGAKDRVTLSGDASSWPSRSKGGWQLWLVVRRSLGEGENPLIWPMCSSLHPVGRPLLRWLRLLELVGRWSNVLKRAKELISFLPMEKLHFKMCFMRICMCFPDFKETPSRLMPTGKSNHLVRNWM